ncbi:MAG: alpha/beta hydrolase, partial [Pseudomonadota bacterium]
REQVVLVHGLWMTGRESVVLRRRLEQHGFAVHQFSYRSVAADMAENASRLNAFAQAVEGDVVHYVGHSLGGLVILRMLADFPDQRPGRVTLLGSPLQGSEVAERLATWPFGERVLGKSIAEEVLAAPERTWDGSRDLGIIAGNRALGMGRVVKALKRPNDGTVAVAETRLPGARAHRVLPVSHSSLLFSTAVADHAAEFLREGRFPPKGTGKARKNKAMDKSSAAPSDAPDAPDHGEDAAPG